MSTLRLACAVDRPMATAAVFTVSIFLSAALLFAVQPMFAKMALPKLGGAPAVWSVALVFFQSVLLLGYLWAHLLATRVSTKTGAALHLAACFLACATLPIAAANWNPPAQGGHGLWLLAFFAVSTGAPFFAVAANGPLLQAWFARTAHARASDPYFLYAASNAGSLVALLAYPFVAEPLLGLSAQSRLWTWGFVCLIGCLALCAALAVRDVSRPLAREPSLGVSWSQRISWMAPSFVASGLLVSVTAHISADVASAPLLWVLPLALFLATFVAAFRDWSARVENSVQLVHAFGVALAILVFLNASPLALPIHLLALTSAALVAHRALYVRRPQTTALTDYYVFMSLGGVAGGVFAALAAPLAFSTVVEYPLLLVASLLCRPGVWPQTRAIGLRAFAAALLGACATAGGAFGLAKAAGLPSPFIVAACAALVGFLLTWRTPTGLAFAIVATLVATVAPAASSGVETFRSFFGVHRISEAEGGRVRLLVHGTTIHGAVRIAAADGSPAPPRPQPTTYYTFSGPLGEAIRSARAKKGGLSHVAIIGLGAGALACHREGDETFAFYEIDPLVVALARDPDRFRFLPACAPQAPVLLGDARLRMADQTEKSDVIVVDAFSSDAIPVHLMTAEAIALYRSRLAEDGVILFHISNRMMDLSGVVARAAAAAGLQTFMRHDAGPAAGREDWWSPSKVAALVRRPEDLGALALGGGPWEHVSPDMRARPWTDDYSTLLQPLLRGLAP